MSSDAERESRGKITTVSEQKGLPPPNHFRVYLFFTHPPLEKNETSTFQERKKIILFKNCKFFYAMSFELIHFDSNFLKFLGLPDPLPVGLYPPRNEALIYKY